jgi:hypothetical protein
MLVFRLTSQTGRLTQKINKLTGQFGFNFNQIKNLKFMQKTDVFESLVMTIGGRWQCKRSTQCILHETRMSTHVLARLNFIFLKKLLNLEYNSIRTMR